MRQIRFLLTVGAISVIGTSFAQDRKMNRANKLFETYAYSDAINIYENVAKKGYKSAELYQKLADSYYHNSELVKASDWYDQLIAIKPDVDAEYYYRYAHSLKARGDYDKANDMLNIFSERTNESRAALYKENKDYLSDIEKDNGRFEITKVNGNTEQSEFAPQFYMGNLVFSSSRHVDSRSETLKAWDNRPFYQLLYADRTTNSLNGADILMKKVRTKYNESTATFAQDGNTVYFTRNNYVNRRLETNKKGTSLLKVFKAERKDNGWGKVEELPFNDDEYMVAHPALTKDGKRLYFASNMPGTKGNSDIYYVDILEDGSYGEPTNLGEHINTEGRETFPFISADNKLYFASDGHPGLGGLDIFMYDLEDRESGIINLGRPVNSSMDDFTFVIDSNTKEGYFASNREGGAGSDDIYALKQLKPIRCMEALAGIVKDKQSSTILPGATMTLMDMDKNVLATVVSDENGSYQFEKEYPCGQNYVVTAKKEGYLINEGIISTSGGAAADFAIALDKEEVPIEIGDDVSELLNIETIYFDFDKHNIREDAKVELQKLIELMKKYPKLKIAIKSHTDAKGSNAYNQKLSNKRAKATMAYIVKGGIAPERLTTAWYGESQPAGNNDDKNRRSEFIVVK